MFMFEPCKTHFVQTALLKIEPLADSELVHRYEFEQESKADCFTVYIPLNVCLKVNIELESGEVNDVIYDVNSKLKVNC